MLFQFLKSLFLSVYALPSIKKAVSPYSGPTVPQEPCKAWGAKIDKIFPGYQRTYITVINIKGLNKARHQLVHVELHS